MISRRKSCRLSYRNNYLFKKNSQRSEQFFLTGQNGKTIVVRWRQLSIWNAAVSLHWMPSIYRATNYTIFLIKHTTWRRKLNRVLTVQTRFLTTIAYLGLLLNCQIGWGRWEQDGYFPVKPWPTSACIPLMHNRVMIKHETTSGILLAKYNLTVQLCLQ